MRTLRRLLGVAKKNNAWCLEKKIKAVSTLRGSQAVTDPSTNRALPRLTSEIGRDPVFSW